MGVASVELRGLTKRYGEVAVVDDVSLTIEHGRLVCLLGPSGCGKTTTLRLIAGFVEPSAGEIRVGDQLMSSPARTLPPERRNMSMIFQSYALWPHMTVAENVAYGLKLRKLDRALIVEPETLLLDEPLSNLDANLREDMRFEVRRLHDEYRYTTVYVTHDQSEAMTTADVIAVMNAGKIEQAGSPEDIYERPRSEFVARFIGSSNVIKGRALDDCHLSCAGSPLRCSGGKFAAGRECAAAIRQHVVGMWAEKPAVTENVVPGTVVRQVFLGASRDYLVEMPDGTQLRVLAPAAENIPPGASVWLHLPPERCRALSG